MKSVYTLANGKQATVIFVQQTGFSSRDTITWEIQSEEKLDDADISLIVDCEYNPCAYGTSLWERVNAPGDKAWRVRVTSWASCD